MEAGPIIKDYLEEKFEYRRNFIRRYFNNRGKKVGNEKDNNATMSRMPFSTA